MVAESGISCRRADVRFPPTIAAAWRRPRPDPCGGARVAVPSSVPSTPARIGTWLLVAIPLLIAAFSVKKAPTLPPPDLQRPSTRPPRSTSQTNWRGRSRTASRVRRGHAKLRVGSLPSSSSRATPTTDRFTFDIPGEGYEAGERHRYRPRPLAAGDRPHVPSRRHGRRPGERTTTPRAPARCSSSRESTPALEPDRAPDAARARRTTSSSSPPMEARSERSVPTACASRAPLSQPCAGSRRHRRDRRQGDACARVRRRCAAFTAATLVETHQLRG